MRILINPSSLYTPNLFPQSCGWDLPTATMVFLSGSGGGGGGGSSSSSAAVVARGKRAREEERVDFGAFDDGVRAPIAARTERLVDFPGGGLGRPRAPVLHAALRNTEAERSGARGGGGGGGGAGGKRPKDLSTLLAPPTDLLFTGTFDEARVIARNNRQWLLVNIQTHDEFACLVLNRDVWRNEAIAPIVRSRFVLWQQERDFEAARNVRTPNPHAAAFCRRYKLEGETFPRVALIDPRSGELLWDHTGPLEAQVAKDFFRNWAADHDWDDARVLPLLRTRDSSLARRNIVDPPSVTFARSAAAQLSTRLALNDVGGSSGAAAGAARANSGSGTTGVAVGRVSASSTSASTTNTRGGVVKIDDDDDDVIIIDDDDDYQFQYESDNGGTAPPPPLPPPTSRLAGTKRLRDDIEFVPTATTTTLVTVPSLPLMGSLGLPRPPQPPVRLLQPPPPLRKDEDDDEFGSMLPKLAHIAPLVSPMQPPVVTTAPNTYTPAFALFPVGGEPVDGPGVIRLQLRFPGGLRVIRRFHGSTDSLRQVAAFAVASLCGYGTSAGAGAGTIETNVILKLGTPPHNTFPPSAFSTSLLDAGLSNTIIIVERTI
jgi:hypothetical protein